MKNFTLADIAKHQLKNAPSVTSALNNYRVIFWDAVNCYTYHKNFETRKDLLSSVLSDIEGFIGSQLFHEDIETEKLVGSSLNSLFKNTMKAELSNSINECIYGDEYPY